MCTRKASYSLIFLALIALLGSGCGKASSFAGFTFGGGGHTFSAEPSMLTFGTISKLTAGTPQQPVYLVLEWESGGHEFNRREIPLSKVEVKVESHGESTQLVDGHIVLQAKDEKVGHGSFQCNVKLEDGREFAIVGSFTADLPAHK